MKLVSAEIVEVPELLLSVFDGADRVRECESRCVVHCACCPTQRANPPVGVKPVVADEVDIHSDDVFAAVQGAYLDQYRLFKVLSGHCGHAHRYHSAIASTDASAKPAISSVRSRTEQVRS
jgi:hypothetical protein